MINVKVRKLHDDAVIPRYATDGASGFDLVAVEDVIISPGETKLVRTGLAFEIPPGYEMQIRPRSGISLKTKLRVANSPGTIDEDFRGEVCVIVDNTTQFNYEVAWGEINAVCHNALHTLDSSGYTPQGNILTEESVPVGTYIIRKGDRIAQGVIVPVVRANLEVTDGDLTETGRGAGSFGHTGITEVDGA